MTKTKTKSKTANKQVIKLGKHRGAAPNDLATVQGQWHVSTSREGSFPHHESKCPCPKAPCGFAAPVAHIACAQHLGDRTVTEVHAATDCSPRISLRDRFFGKDATSPEA